MFNYVPMYMKLFTFNYIICLSRYKVGDRLSPENEKVILERLLPYHPAYDTKIGCGVESIMVTKLNPTTFILWAL